MPNYCGDFNDEFPEESGTNQIFLQKTFWVAYFLSFEEIKGKRIANMSKGVYFLESIVTKKSSQVKSFHSSGSYLLPFS